MILYQPAELHVDVIFSEGGGGVHVEIGTTVNLSPLFEWSTQKKTVPGLPCKHLHRICVQRNAMKMQVKCSLQTDIHHWIKWQPAVLRLMGDLTPAYTCLISALLHSAGKLKSQDKLSARKQKIISHVPLPITSHNLPS